MCELTKLEVGKTYVFKDEESKQAYINYDLGNLKRMELCYDRGFTVTSLIPYGSGFHGECCVIAYDQLNYFKLKEENVMPIKPEDEVTITTTYRELAVCYAVLGRIQQGGGGEDSLWLKLKELLDPEQKVYNNLIYGKDFYDIVKYSKYKSKWEELLFPQKPVETQQQIQIRELREQAEALLQKAKELEGDVL